MFSSQTILLIVKFGVAAPLVVGFCAWLLYRAYHKADEPAGLVIKWVVTGLISGYWGWQVTPQAGGGGAYSIDSLLVTLVLSLTLAITWRHSIGALIARPFMFFYDGGNSEIEPQPYYSTAQGRCKKGQYAEAILEIRRQLAQFPRDFSGQLLLAEIQAEKLHDLAGAEMTLKAICRQPNHPPRNLALAMNTLADWKLKYDHDVEAARDALQSISFMLPDTEFATMAEQRMAHLRPAGETDPGNPSSKFEVPHNSQPLGLLPSTRHLIPAEASPTEASAEFIRQLEQYPLDHEARERLALLYADEFHRLDLALEQLEQLISAPNQPARQTVRWLNLIADLQIREGKNYEAAKAALNRIIELFPAQAAAGLARNRRELLKLELRANEKSQTVRLGSYEQNIGLKRGSAHQP